ncbi:Succinate--CoA ligase [GDP-forming] subunit beta [Acropora cervicornis]|uniref:Succinate--CoA ligase [GDP-forming] subunit beta n=1 Tax=Acropora cervicornis TaxID=6130 RepID=A0AAD9VE60_ACRCE|nr:Succinate--CoA ligase [GDP-forming] subunit beta [Acropora cervicornis]
MAAISRSRNFTSFCRKCACISSKFRPQSLQTGAVALIQTRWLNLQEYQSKTLMADNGLHVQRFKVTDNAKEAVQIAKELNVKEFVVKAQILAGGRGKGSFSSGLKSGVHVTQDANKVGELIEDMVGYNLTTPQTLPSGVLVKKVAIDIFKGIQDTDAKYLAEKLEFKGPLLDEAAKQIKLLYKLFLKVDATQVEINPFGETLDGKVVCFDAKFNFDDSAKFRQRDVFAMDDESESDPREVEAGKHALNYISLDGDIACLVNGAGLAMATMDIIKLYGGSPANFLDLGGRNVKAAKDILTKSGMPLIPADDMDDAAKKVVDSLTS